MKQAIHIFLKDLRGLWIQVATLMLVIGIFALVDITNTNPGGTMFTLIVGAAVWFLIARAVHQESLPGENQFWLTRPYERNSLLISKLLMAACIIIVPLFAADCIILLAQSLPLAENLGGLVLRQFIVAGWLVLPPFAVATVTRSITEDILVWIAGLAIAGLGYFPGSYIPDFRSSNEKYLILVALALMLAAIWRQYFTRGTKLGRALIAAAVLLPVLPFPESAALAIEGLRNNPATARISIAPQSQSIAEPARAGIFDMHCAPLAVSVEGMRPGWRLNLMSQQDTFTTAGGKTHSGPWWPTGFLTPKTEYENSPGISWWTFNICLNSAGLRELGSGPLAVHTSVAFAVLAENPPIRIEASLNPFRVQGVGTCQFQYGLPFRHNYELDCKAPVWFPQQGRVVMDSNDSWSSGISTVPYPWIPLNLLPGISPVYKWDTLPMNAQIRDTIAQHGQIEFRTATRIAVLRRELTVKEALFQPTQ
jgi:hypothetical protein